MLHPVRILFRSLTDESEEGTGHVHRVSLPRAVKLRSLYAKLNGLAPSESSGDLYRIRFYAADPRSSCWHLEMKAASRGEDSRTPDVLHQGLEVHLPDTFWITYELMTAVATPGARLELEMLLEGARG